MSHGHWIFLSKVSLTVLVMLVLLGACAPRLSDLLQKRHYREAIYMADEPLRPGADREQVFRAVVADLAPAIHLAPVDEVRMRQLIGDAARSVLDKAVVLKLTIEGTSVPIDDIKVLVAFLTETEVLTESSPTREHLVALTGERPLGARKVKNMGSYVRTSDPSPPPGWDAKIPLKHWSLDTIRAVGATANGVKGYAYIFSLGMAIEGVKRLLTLASGAWPRWRGQSHYPTAKEWAAQAPVAETLYRAMASSPKLTKGTHRWHRSRFVLFPRPTKPVRAVAIRLYIKATTETCPEDSAHRMIRANRPEWSSEPVVLPLAAGASLERRVTGTFGSTMRLVRPSSF